MNRFTYILFGAVVGATLSALVFYSIDYVNQSEKVTESPLNSVDTVIITSEPEIQIERVVEKVNVPSNDTVMLLTNINQNVDSGDYVVLRDQLLSTKKVNIIHKTQASGDQASDVLHDRINTDNLFAENIMVEFWESPIDYQGYRLNKTKLILFGINPNESFELINQNEGFLIMKSGGQTLLLHPTEKYRTFNFQ